MKKSGHKRWERNTESVDDYLKAINTLGGDDRRWVFGSEIASRLDIAPASVTNMLQKLASQPKSFVDYRRGEGVRLTTAGRRRALEVIRHHRLVETFLHEVLGYSVDELHDEAERLEHFISEKFEERIAEKLGNPQSDPHGHCIPAYDGSMPSCHRLTCTCE